MEKKRIEWVDIAKYICALFVIIIHLESNTGLLGKFYEPFLLNGFLFLSGYTFRYRQDFGPFFQRKVHQLLIPWFFFGILIVISGNIISPDPSSHHGIFRDLLWFFVQIRERNDAMWFVAALFISYIPFYFLIKFYQNSRRKKHLGEILLTVLLILFYLGSLYERKFPKNLFFWYNNKLPWHIEYIPNALFFMYFGYLFREKYEKYFDRINKPVFAIILSVFYLYLIYGNAWLYFNKRTEYRIVFSIICQITGVLLLISFSKHIRPNRAILYIGQNSLIYFGIAHYLNVPIQLILKTVVPSFYTTVLSNEYYSAIFSIIFAVISSLILIIPAYIINTYFPFLIGRKKVSKQS